MYIAKKTSRNNSPLQKFDADGHRNFRRMASGLQLAGVLIDPKGVQAASRGNDQPAIPANNEL